MIIHSSSLWTVGDIKPKVMTLFTWGKFGAKKGLEKLCNAKLKNKLGGTSQSSLG